MNRSPSLLLALYLVNLLAGVWCRWEEKAMMPALLLRAPNIAVGLRAGDDDDDGGAGSAPLVTTGGDGLDE